MVSPEMPTGRAVRQSVLHHQPHRQRDDPLGVVALGWGEVPGVHVEVTAAFAAVMLGVREMDVPRSFADQIPQIMQRPLDGAIAVAASAAFRAWPSREIAAALDQLGLRQVFNTRNPFRPIGSVLSWPRHRHPPWCNWDRKNTVKRSPNQYQSPAIMVQTLNDAVFITRNRL